MSDLKYAILVVEIVVIVVLTMLLGDYLGYKIGRWRLAAMLGIITLVCVVAFAIYAAVLLA